MAATRPRVLLADDHAGIVNVLERLLAPECDIVADGSEVAAAAARLQPVVVVVDLNLPTINGLEVCRHITRTNARAKLIVITCTIDDAIEEEALAAGASAFVHKGAAGTELIATIQQVWTKTM
jgi:DNA-binding NarL/FixJ family response regulator